MPREHATGTTLSASPWKTQKGEGLHGFGGLGGKGGEYFVMMGSWLIDSALARFHDRDQVTTSGPL
jgi:hypothetical protein